MDAPLRTRLLLALVGVALLGGLLAVSAGTVLIRRLVVGEAERRVALALKTARAVLHGRLDDVRKMAVVTALNLERGGASAPDRLPSSFLEGLRTDCACDFLQIVDADGTIRRSARARVPSPVPAGSAVVFEALKTGRAASAVSLLPLEALEEESPVLAARSTIDILPTPRAKPGQAKSMTDAMVLEAAAPIHGEDARVIGAVRVGVVLNRNSDLVDFIRDSIFTHVLYEGKSLGTVTIFQRDVRVATNVTDARGRRAVGTRVSAEVFDRVLGEGKTWRGPAFVVDSWYISAYEPIRDRSYRIIGMLYVGVLQQRYDDMQREALGVFLMVSWLAVGGAVLLSSWLAAQLAQPITRLTAAAAAVARGDLGQHLPAPEGTTVRDDIRRLTMAFNQMVAALRGRDDQLRQSHQELSRTAEELKRWNENYLDTLEFITHELKNQVAAMKINLMALRDGYVGDLEDDQREALDDVLGAVNRAENMILNYLNLSRIERGELQVRARPLMVEQDVVRPVLRDLRARLEARGMRVQSELTPDLPVHADPSLLQIVYENLLSNAVKYGREGGLVRLWGRLTDGYVELHVWNEGQGVPPHQMPRLFEKFSRLHESGEAERGTGLGLYIAREIVHKHGGEIWAEGEEGKWIDLIVTLPRADVPLEEGGAGES